MNQVQQIEIYLLKDHPDNPRLFLREEVITGIQAQLKETGMFDPAHALLVRPMGDYYQIVRGHHRKEAAKQAGLETVPCWVREMSDDEAYMQLALGNVQGELSPLEIGIHALKINSIKELAAQSGVTERSINQNKASALVISSIRNGTQVPILKQLVTKSKHLYIISQLKYPTLWPILIEWIIKADASVSQTEAYIKQIAARIDPIRGFNSRWELFLPINQVAFSDLSPQQVQALINAAITTEKIIDELCEELGGELGYTGKRFLMWLSEGIGTYAWDISQIEHYRVAVLERAEQIRKPPEPDIKPGEWYQLGAHLLYCGDTSLPSFYGRFDPCGFAFADPPYNANAAEWDMNFKWEHDWLIQKASIVAVTPGISSIQKFFNSETSMPYRWSVSAWITNGMTRGALGFGNWVYVALFAKPETGLHRNSQDILRVNIQTSDTGDTNHKGRKPSEILEALLEMFTEQGEIVIDPFLGSGTTLFAAEKLQRACIGGEINPEFCNAIIDRWQKETGKIARRVDMQ